MRVIRFVLAGSDTALSEERLELAAHIESLNKLYVRRGIYFELADEAALDDDRDRAIRDAQYFYVLFGREEDMDAVREFDLALAAFRERNAPKLYTYFMQLPAGQRAAEGVRTFMERVDRELGHFHSVFSHIDSVKLDLVMELCRDPLIGGAVKLEDGLALVDGQAVLSMENIPLYSKNETVQRLLAEKLRLDEEFAALVSLGNSEPILRMRLEKDLQRSRIAEQLHTLEMDIFRMYEDFSKKRSDATRLDPLELRAMELLEAGQKEAAETLLRDPLLDRESEQSDELYQVALDRKRKYISIKRTLIRVLSTTGVTSESEQEIISLYEKIAALAEQYRIELDTLYDYAAFLWRHNRFSEGIRPAERLRRIYSAEAVTEDEQAELLNLLGLLYSDNRDFQKAEALYGEALSIYRRLAEGQPGAYEPGVAMTCNNLALLLADTNRHDEAETLYREALSIYRRLAEGQPGAYEPGVANICNNLADLLKNINQYGEAETMFRDALSIYRRLAEGQPGAYEPGVAMTCNNLAALLENTGRYEEAERLFRDALAIRRRLAEGQPGAYEPGVADTCNNLAILLADTNRHDEEETLYREALEIRRRLAEGQPEAYEPDVADTCFNLAIFRYTVANDEVAAKELFNEALAIYARYPHREEDAEDVCEILRKWF